MEMINAIGRRKTAVARVYLMKGEGNITVNGKDYREYFPQIHIQHNVTDPFTTVGAENIYDLKVNVRPGASPRRSKQCNRLVLFDCFADGDKICAVMGIAGDVAVAVTYLNEIPVAPTFARPGNDTRRYSPHGLTRLAGKIETIVEFVPPCHWVGPIAETRRNPAIR